MVHEILGIRAQPDLVAGARIPTRACGMIRTWRADLKKWLMGAPCLDPRRPEPERPEGRACDLDPRSNRPNLLPGRHGLPMSEIAGSMSEPRWCERRKTPILDVASIGRARAGAKRPGE